MFIQKIFQGNICYLLHPGRNINVYTISNVYFPQGKTFATLNLNSYTWFVCSMCRIFVLDYTKRKPVKYLEQSKVDKMKN